MKKKLIQKIVEKLNLVGNEKEKTVSDGLLHMPTEGLKALAAVLGVTEE